MTAFVTSETERTIRELANRLKSSLARTVLHDSLNVAIDDPDLDDEEMQTVAGIIADAIDFLDTRLVGPCITPEYRREAEAAIRELTTLPGDRSKPARKGKG